MPTPEELIAAAQQRDAMAAQRAAQPRTAAVAPPPAQTTAAPAAQTTEPPVEPEAAATTPEPAATESLPAAVLDMTAMKYEPQTAVSIPMELGQHVTERADGEGTTALQNVAAPDEPANACRIFNKAMTFGQVMELRIISVKSEGFAVGIPVPADLAAILVDMGLDAAVISSRTWAEVVDAVDLVIRAMKPESIIVYGSDDPRVLANPNGFAAIGGDNGEFLGYVTIADAEANGTPAATEALVYAGTSEGVVEIKASFEKTPDAPVDEEAATHVDVVMVEHEGGAINLELAMEQAAAADGGVTLAAPGEAVELADKSGSHLPLCGESENIAILDELAYYEVPDGAPAQPVIEVPAQNAPTASEARVPHFSKGKLSQVRRNGK